MGEIYNIEELRESIDEESNFLELSKEEEKSCLMGYIERAGETSSPLYDREKVIKILKELPENQGIFYFTKINFNELNDSTVIYPEFTSVFLGITSKDNEEHRIPLYDMEKSVKILEKDMKDVECNEDETPYSIALESFYYNTVSAWYGNTTPAFATLILKE